MLLIIVLSACAPATTTFQSKEGTTAFDSSSSEKLSAFSSLEDYQAFANANSNNYYGGYARGGIAVDFAFDAAVAESAPSPAALTKLTSSVAVEDGASSLDYSETNNQVQGVDEADILKTDGNYIYTITGKTLFIISSGEEANIVSQISLDSYPQGLFIDGDTLAVFGNEYNDEVYDLVGFQPQSGMTYFHTYDISDRSNPELVDEYSFEGNYFDARLVDDQVYFVVQSSPEYRPIHPLPIIYDGASVKEVSLDRILWYPGNYDYAQLVTVHSIDLSKKKDLFSLSVAVDNLQTIYMSADNLFLVGSEYVSEYEIEQEVTRDMVKAYLTQDDADLIALINSVDERVLSLPEKEQKIMEVYYARINYLGNEEQTDLYKSIDKELADRLDKIKYYTYTTLSKINLEGDMSYVASEKVPGRITNQFSLDEYENNLRIATTVDAHWSRTGEQTESYTNVFVLDDSLRQVGSLMNLAPTERIYSTRFVDDRLYMVTFRQVDPFFVIDLSNPEKPSELGQLKIPGFSRYLHPYDETHLIGIGQDATELGRTTGLKISLYDVTDVENPIEVAKYVTDEKYASSSALYEHKAFLFSKEKNLLVIPAYSWGWEDGDKYNGAFVFNINTSEIELRGLIDHSQSDNFQQVERSLYINDLLYTKSPYLLRINRLEDLSSVKDIALKEKIGIPVY
ncbi:MAG: beta-propeller domain-containing protein, partial [Nanoarchaeota archaeon]|nr:beta-propeller domain-containing protein [Nanoarchaeota archaeon]